MLPPELANAPAGVPVEDLGRGPRSACAKVREEQK